VVLAAAGLVKDFEADSSPIPGEFRLTGDVSEGTLTRFEEDLTWNRCLRLTDKGPDAQLPCKVGF